MSLDAIGIVSGDLKKSIEFYSLLGVNFEQFEDSEHYEAATPSGVRLMMDSEKLMKEINPEWKKATGVSVVMCFKKDSAQDVNETFDKIMAGGFKSVKEPWDAFWGQRYSSVLDPDGNQIDIFAGL